MRKIYHDPLTGKDEWGLVRGAQGRIAGVYSLAAGRPIQRTAFDPALASFDEADSYRQWVFGLESAGPASAPAR